MSNLVFYMDYGPLLSRVLKSAFVVYMYFDKFKNDQGIVQITYNELNDHLGLATSTIQKSLSLLKKLELIEEVESTQGKRYKMLPVKNLTPQLKSEILQLVEVEDYNEQTSIKKRYLQDDIPADFQQLLNKKVLKKAYKDLGTLRSGKELCEYFKIDYYTFRLLHELEGDSSFKVKFKSLAKEVESEANPPKKQEQAIGESERSLATFLYDKLNTLGAKPINKSWFIKNCNMAKALLATISLEEAKDAIEWGFQDSWWHDKITDLNSVTTLYTRHKLQNKKPPKKITRNTPLPDEVKQVISSQTSSSIEVNTYEDAYMLKQSILDGQTKKDILAIVEILELHGIVPLGRENLKFG